MPSEKSELRVFSPDKIVPSLRDLYGDEYQAIVRKVKRIMVYQRDYSIQDGIKGFIFYGEPGVGKTVAAKGLAADLPATLVFVDGMDIARKWYGETEQQIGKVFDEAQSHRVALILIDDCESLFPARDWAKVESWHLAQNNVFFHRLDEVDPSRTAVILTTNRYDLLDKAIKDRLYSLEFPLPHPETLLRIAEAKCRLRRMDLTEDIERVIMDGKLKSVRELERLLTEKYIEHIARSAPQ